MSGIKFSVETDVDIFFGDEKDCETDVVENYDLNGVCELGDEYDWQSDWDSVLYNYKEVILDEIKGKKNGKYHIYAECETNWFTSYGGEFGPEQDAETLVNYISVRFMGEVADE